MGSVVAADKVDMKEPIIFGAADAELGVLLDALPCAGFLLRDEDVIAASGRAAEICGWDLKGAGVGDVFLGAFTGVAGECASFECLLVRRGDRPMPVHGALRKLADGSTMVVAMEWPGVDAGGQGAYLADLLDSSPEAMALTNAGLVLHVNQAFTRLFGHALEAAVGRDLDGMLMPEGRQFENEILQHMLAEGGRGGLETVRMNRAGEALDVSVQVSPMRLSGSVMGRFYTFRDIREQKKQEAKLHHTAMHDALTGLANRALLLDRLKLTLARLRRRPERSFAVMFLDLDGFKAVNDALGHHAGDALLKDVAQLLKECVRPQDTVARFGGDEFAVLLDEAGTSVDAQRVAERIQASFAEAAAYGGEGLRVSASVGIVFVERAYGGAEEILRDADLAMYQAKAAGKARHAFAALAGEASARIQPCLGS